ncbi:ferrous iron efflux protein F [Vibrio cholerae]|uniref:Ferrous iron efflux protein F n=1 Tax=Vibrio cholerae TaxID=666 RepID=A0A655QA68_VIBCL|nr:ferrous iron efflux protein F [Vibrio cholerae]
MRFIQLHLELDDNISLLEAHQISDRVEDKLREHFVGADVLIHQDPHSVVLEAEQQQKSLQ